MHCSPWSHPDAWTNNKQILTCSSSKLFLTSWCCLIELSRDSLDKLKSPFFTFLTELLLSDFSWSLLKSCSSLILRGTVGAAGLDWHFRWMISLFLLIFCILDKAFSKTSFYFSLCIFYDFYWWILICSLRLLFWLRFFYSRLYSWSMVFRRFCFRFGCSASLLGRS